MKLNQTAKNKFGIALKKETKIFPMIALSLLSVFVGLLLYAATLVPSVFWNF